MSPRRHWLLSGLALCLNGCATARRTNGGRVKSTILTAAEVDHALRRALPHLTTIRLGDPSYAATTREELQAIARRAWRPWTTMGGSGTCEAQALAVKHEAYQQAERALLSHNLAIGFVWTNRLHGSTEGHTFSWCIDALGEVSFFNQTTGFFVPASELRRRGAILALA